VLVAVPVEVEVASGSDIFLATIVLGYFGLGHLIALLMVAGI
jgi:hypothetical protein